MKERKREVSGKEDEEKEMGRNGLTERERERQKKKESEREG